MLLQNWVRQQADQRPDAYAIRWQDEALTYGELEADANRLARLLISMGCSRGDRVALLTPKRPRTIVAMLGVLKAGCVYAPVDVLNPPERTRRILETLSPTVVLAARTERPLLERLLAERELDGDLRIGWLDDGEPAELGENFQWRDLSCFSGEPRDPAGAPLDLAHILFTSGSTGFPKGVMITHANVTSFVTWAVRHFGITGEDRTSGHAPLHFDLSTFDIYGSFAAGAELNLVPPETNLLPAGLAEFIRERRLTHWFSVPSILYRMAQCDAIRQNDFPELKRVLWCGEAFPTPGLIHWMKRLPHARFTNLYGPTEATVASSYYDVETCPTDLSDPVPIGAPCQGEELLVLRTDMTPADPGEIGDLYIGGSGLSPGYWRDPERTRMAFLTSAVKAKTPRRIYRTGDLARVDESGAIRLLGRSDSQIKCRGYRIELGEIEQAMHGLAEIRESAVIALPSMGFEGACICCAYVPRENAQGVEMRLRTALRRLLPHYMIPDRWLAFESLPLNPNGKIDRPALQRIFAGDGKQEESKTA